VKRLATLLIALVPVLASCGTGAAAGPLRIEIRIHYSPYEPSAITVPAGQPVTFVLINDDPIDHEWIVGDAALHERHRTGTELHHDARPTEVSIDALTTRETTVTFASPAALTFVCHLPGHEAFGMVGTLIVTPGP
jgi:uncharacterized cupredoxin-like copper-binding protein